MNHDHGAMDLDQGAGPALTPFNKLSEAAQKELQDNCRKQFEQLELLQDEIVLLSDMSGETLPESVNRLILTKSELSLILNSPANLSSKHPEVLREAVNEEMEKLCSELEMVLSWNKAKKETFLECFEREQKLLEEKGEVYKAAVAHTEQMRQDKESRSTKKCLKDHKDKLGKLDAYHNKILEIMMNVIEEHFQLPDVQEDLLPLETILEHLMNKALQTTHDPYVTIDETFWPPYIEILLRYGIAVRHPEDNFKIRLESF